MNELVNLSLNIVLPIFATELFQIIKPNFAKLLNKFSEKVDKEKIKNIDPDIVSKCIYSLYSSQEELSEIYANIINNFESNITKDKILTYFSILSNMTHRDLSILNTISTSSLEISQDTDKDIKLSINVLSNHNLIQRDGIRWNDMDGSINGIYIITDIGIDFLKNCKENK